METLLASSLFTHAATLAAGLFSYPVVHYFVSKVTTTVSSDVATLKADVAALKAKLP
jgi:hypothetical protein